MAGPETPAEITAAVKQIDAEFEPKPQPPTPEQKANLKRVADQLFGIDLERPRTAALP